MAKLVLLGGGSPFTPSIFQTVLEHKEALSGSEICLMDLSDARLPQLKKLGEVMAARADMDLTITTTTDERAALEGADFVFPGYRVGGIEAMRQDHVIPTRYGICGDETAGPGGTFMAQCTIPATLHYCRLMEELCPDAWAISYVNPTNFVADAVRRASSVRFLAICDCWPGFRTSLASILGVEDRGLTARAMGVNHLTWLTQVAVNGEDVYPLLRERAKSFRPDQREWSDEWAFSMRILDAYDHLLVCPSHPRMYWEHDATMNKRRNLWEDPDIGGRTQSMAEGWKFVDEMIAGAPYDETRPHLAMHHPRHAIGIAVSILTNEGREWGGMNYPNRGSVVNLPADAIVEGSCLVGAAGPIPLALGELPKPMLGLIQHVLNWQELTVDAALSGDRKTLYQALLACPYVHDMEAAKQIMEELLAAHADYMPQFR